MSSTPELWATSYGSDANYPHLNVWIPGTSRLPMAVFRGVEPAVRFARVRAIGLSPSELWPDGELVLDDLIVEAS